MSIMFGNNGHDNCCSVYFNQIIFHRGGITFNIDIVHNRFKSRIKNLDINFNINIFTMGNPVLAENLANIVNMGAIEGQKELEVKFMDNTIRDDSKKMLEIFLKKFETVKDNIIILVLKNRSTIDA